MHFLLINLGHRSGKRKAVRWTYGTREVFDANRHRLILAPVLIEMRVRHETVDKLCYCGSRNWKDLCFYTPDDEKCPDRCRRLRRWLR